MYGLLIFSCIQANLDVVVWWMRLPTNQKISCSIPGRFFFLCLSCNACRHSGIQQPYDIALVLRDKKVFRRLKA